MCGLLGRPPAVYRFSSYLSNNGRCVRQCPVGYYGNVRERKCIRCDVTCDTCADGASGGDCLSCDMHRVLHAGRCLTACPVDWSVHNSSTTSQCILVCPPGHTDKNGTCTPCDASCATCTDVTLNCTSCDPDYVHQYSFVNGTENEASHFGISDGGVFGSCQSVCKIGYYANSQGRCQVCTDPSCQLCVRGGIYCTQCSDSTILYLGQCVTNCPQGLYSVDGACATKCRDGYYGTADECRSCPGLCRRCFAKNPGKCSACSISPHCLLYATT
jgi:proprotein convertase subtilisin/kexin type 5